MMADKIAPNAFKALALLFAVVFIALVVEAMDEPSLFIAAGMAAALSYLSAKAGGMDVE